MSPSLTGLPSTASSFCHPDVWPEKYKEHLECWRGQRCSRIDEVEVQLLCRYPSDTFSTWNLEFNQSQANTEVLQQMWNFHNCCISSTIVLHRGHNSRSVAGKKDETKLCCTMNYSRRRELKRRRMCIPDSRKGGGQQARTGKQQTKVAGVMWLLQAKQWACLAHMSSISVLTTWRKASAAVGWDGADMIILWGHPRVPRHLSVHQYINMDE